MPRARGQIDARKSEAIITAAFAVLAERGLSAPLEEVARRANVSKQTVYNHYGSKIQLIKTLIQRRQVELTAPLVAPDATLDPVQTLSHYGLAMIHSVVTEPYGQLMRLAVSGAQDEPDLADIIYRSGILDARTTLATYLDKLVVQQKLKIEDTQLAAEMFAGMMLGGLQLQAMTGRAIPRDPVREQARSRTCAAIFLKAFAV